MHYNVNNKNMEKLAKRILEEVYVKPTKKKVQGIIDLLSLEDKSETDICDYLGLERRGNRAAIRSVLNNYKKQ